MFPLLYLYDPIDGLNWDKVKLIIEKVFQNSSVKIEVYAHSTPNTRNNLCFRAMSKNAYYAVALPVANHVYQALMPAEGTYSALKLFIRVELGIEEQYISSVPKKGKLCPTTKLGGAGPTPWKNLQGDAERALQTVIEDLRLAYCTGGFQLK